MFHKVKNSSKLKVPVWSNKYLVTYCTQYKTSMIRVLYHVDGDVVVGHHDAGSHDHQQQPVDDELEQSAFWRETPQQALDARNQRIRFIFCFRCFFYNVNHVVCFLGEPGERV